MGNQDTRAPSNISKIQGGVYTYNKIGEPLKQEHHTVTVDSPTPMLAYGARFTDKTRPEPFRPRTAGCPHSPSFAPRSTPRHTSAAHLSLFSSLPFISARTRNSNVRNNCDGGHLNSAECSGGTPPERTSKLERCAFLFLGPGVLIPRLSYGICSRTASYGLRTKSALAPSYPRPLDDARA